MNEGIEKYKQLVGAKHKKIKKTKLIDKPVVQEKLAEIKKIAQVKRKVDNLSGIQKAVDDPEIKQILIDILEKATMPESQKDYIKNYFFHNWTLKQAFQITKGREAKDDKEALREGKSILESPAVKEFLEVIRAFYVSVLPVAATKKMQMLLDPNTKDGVRIEIIKNIEETAGVTSQQKQAQLPYNVTINVPVQQNTQVNQGEQK